MRDSAFHLFFGQNPLFLVFFFLIETTVFAIKEFVGNSAYLF